jgi:hypothetical protein
VDFSVLGGNIMANKVNGTYGRVTAVVRRINTPRVTNADGRFSYLMPIRPSILSLNLAGRKDQHTDEALRPFMQALSSFGVTRGIFPVTVKIDGIPYAPNTWIDFAVSTFTDGRNDGGVCEGPTYARSGLLAYDVSAMFSGKENVLFKGGTWIKSENAWVIEGTLARPLVHCGHVMTGKGPVQNIHIEIPAKYQVFINENDPISIKDPKGKLLTPEDLNKLLIE